MNIGIIGSGQLGWMMILEGRKLPNRYFVLDEKSGPAALVSDGYFPVDAYRRFTEKCDVITYEFEHVNQKALEHAERSGKLLPGMLPIRLKRERQLEKEYLRDEGFPVGRFAIASNAAEARRLAGEFEKSVIKASKGGYDGKGQYFVDSGSASTVGTEHEGHFVVEEWIDFDAEASIIVSRDHDGTVRSHTPSFNLNRKGMLFYNTAPFDDHGMKRIATKLLKKLDYVGVMGIEFFIKNGRALINEFAPRVHNTGHHTLHGSSISQFEQHLRAIGNLPIHPPELFVPSGVLNIIGMKLNDRLEREILSVPGTDIYWYGKEGVRRRRKVGHINVTARSTVSLRKKIDELTGLVYGDEPEKFL